MTSKPIHEIDVSYVAHLARMHLTDEEKARFQSQLGGILEYVKSLEELDVSGIEPTSHAIPVHNVLRDDVEQPSLDHEKAMANAPEEKKSQFHVPKIIDQASA